MKNCDRGLENAARGRRPRAAFCSPRPQFFTIRTDPKPVNNLFIFFLACERAEFSKSCNLIGSVSGRKFSILPAHGAIPPG